MTRTLRVLRQIVAPNGRHRPRRAVLLPDAPIAPTAEPVPHVVLDADELEQLLDSGDIAAVESARCPKCGRNTVHGMNRDSSRRCFDCGTTTAAMDGAQ